MLNDDPKVGEAKEVVPALVGSPDHCQELQLNHTVTSFCLRDSERTKHFGQYIFAETFGRYALVR